MTAPAPKSREESDFVKRLRFWRAQRPDEWIMDEFIKGVKDLESSIMALQSEGVERTREFEYAKRLAIYGVKKFAKDAENWKPLETMMGVLSQIDNLLAGIIDPEDAKATISRLQSEVERVTEEAKWCRCIVARGYENEKCRNCGLFAKNPFEKAGQPK